MTDVQLSFSIGVPTIAIILGMLVNMVQVSTINARITDGNNRLSSLESRLSSLEGKWDARFDLLIGKLADVDSRLSRVEERLRIG